MTNYQLWGINALLFAPFRLSIERYYVDHDYSAHFIEDLKFLHQRLCKGLCPQQVDNLNGWKEHQAPKLNEDFLHRVEGGYGECQPSQDKDEGIAEGWLAVLT